MEITVGARDSLLSRAQVVEVLGELQKHHPDVAFETQFVTTVGDRDQQTSLKELDKTDFFTRDIDWMQLNGQCRISIHSAKDLPDPLPKGLKLIALTKGVDSGDSLVLRKGATLDSLPENPKIATSSKRREEEVKKLLPHADLVDIRGSVDNRLFQLTRGKVDGVVVAEAALIRLGLTHVTRVALPGETVPLQGRLAILARDDDAPMHELFEVIHHARLSGN